MQRKSVQRLVSTVSLGIAVLALALFAYFRFNHQAAPLWNDVLLSYGLVFAVFWLMDSLFKQAARMRGQEQASSSPRRPLPTVSAQPGQRAVAAPRSSGPARAVRLERVPAQDAERLTAMLDQAIPELLALEDLGISGSTVERVGSGPVDAWLGNSQVYAFFILNGEQYVGCGTLRAVDSQSEACLEFFYIESKFRRQYLGREALERLLEFADLLGVGHRVSARVSTRNARGQRFLASAGFAEVAKNPADDFTYEGGCQFTVGQSQQVWVRHR